MSERNKTLEEASSLLAQIEADLPLRVTEMTAAESETVIGTVRDSTGAPVLAPHPESLSMLTGSRRYFELLVFGPRIIRELFDLASGGENAEKGKRTPSEAETS